jgi:hypothetical protein
MLLGYFVADLDVSKRKTIQLKAVNQRLRVNRKWLILPMLIPKPRDTTDQRTEPFKSQSSIERESLMVRTGLYQVSIKQACFSVRDVLQQIEIPKGTCLHLRLHRPGWNLNAGVDRHDDRCVDRCGHCDHWDLRVEPVCVSEAGHQIRWDALLSC